MPSSHYSQDQLRSDQKRKPWRCAAGRGVEGDNGLSKSVDDLLPFSELPEGPTHPLASTWAVASVGVLGGNVVPNAFCRNAAIVGVSPDGNAVTRCRRDEDERVEARLLIDEADAEDAEDIVDEMLSTLR